MSTNESRPLADHEREAIETLLDRLDEREKDRFFAFVMRLRNRDERAYRLAELAGAGKISLRQLLEKM